VLRYYDDLSEDKYLTHQIKIFNYKYYSSKAVAGDNVSKADDVLNTIISIKTLLPFFFEYVRKSNTFIIVLFFPPLKDHILDVIVYRPFDCAETVYSIL
jgi:hypothetical protein